ncbi:DUF6265 family protein [Jiulongibacter sediminis]|uniref:DUF6265 domain-containing protein n=1 Tax=Jiulongibacter sediminis TaxID=1605367 RepID=A0A0N8H9I8_9BACT|nr:DUF6265 family protein [Jiulongibacter sediminis]KPM47492.1 hypothetical protein AFM12_13345 [Jiulongibacter sediminis]TBX23285.1 hypothetical protein TK44_13355 [Jiulongibacter sediminis]
MRFLILVIIAGLFNSCSTSLSEEKQENNLDWLLGSWQRTNDEDGRETFESWSKQNDSNYYGLGYTLSEGDTVFREDLRIFRKDSSWVFEVTGVNEDPTLFIFTQSDSVSFLAENPENDFPKAIEYKKTKEGFHAEVKSDEMSIGFDFIHSLD